MGDLSKFDGNYEKSLQVENAVDGTSLNAKGDPTNNNAIYVDSTVSLVTAPTGINGGNVTVGTTEVEMTFTGTTKSLFVQSDPDNTGRVWIGLTGVTNVGGNAFVQLEPGDGITYDLNDASAAIFAISDTASQNVFKSALT